MARVYDRFWLVENIAADMRRRAAGFRFDGSATPENARVLRACTGDHLPTGSRLLFTLDVGHHTGGWWKNPDYERCFHLSLSFRDPLTGEQAPKDIALTRRWIEAFYGDAKRYVWAEPPYTSEGKRGETWHYRVFCDPSWSPIVPRGEVYSRELTEAGWLSFSDLEDAHARAAAALVEAAS